MTDKTTSDKPLTPQQEAFCRGIESGLSQRKAYFEAYPQSKKWTEKCVDTRASQLFGRDEIQGRLASHREALAAKYLWTREDSVRVLRDVTDSDKGSERVSAVKELNSMHGFNAPINLNHTGGLTVNLVIEGVSP